MGYNDISLHNGGAADGSLKTPNIDSLAQSGAWFQEAMQLMQHAHRQELQ